MALAGTLVRARSRRSRHAADLASGLRNAGSRAHIPGDTGRGAEVQGPPDVQFGRALPLVLHAGFEKGDSVEGLEGAAATGGTGAVARRPEREKLYKSRNDPQARRSVARIRRQFGTYARSRSLLLHVFRRAVRKW